MFYKGTLQRVPADLSPATYLFRGSTGYDGQFYRYVAHYSFGRAISPLLLFLLLHATNRWRVALVPPLMILLSVGVLSASTAWRIVQGIFGPG